MSSSIRERSTCGISSGNGSSSTGELENVESREGAPHASHRCRFAHSSLRQAENDREQHDHTEEKNHPRSVFSFAEAAKEPEGVGGGSEWKKCGGGPAEEQGDRVREKCSRPAEVSCYVTVPVEPGVAFGGKSSTEENREQQEDDPTDLAGKRRLRGSIVPVPARAS